MVATEFVFEAQNFSNSSHRVALHLVTVPSPKPHLSRYSRHVARYTQRCPDAPEWLPRCSGMAAQMLRNGCPGAPERLPRCSGTAAQVLPERLPRSARNPQRSTRRRCGTSSTPSRCTWFRAISRSAIIPRPSTNSTGQRSRRAASESVGAAQLFLKSLLPSGTLLDGEDDARVHRLP